MIIAFNSPDDPEPGNGGGSGSDDATPGQPENSGTIILDATCAPQNISYPLDISLLNEVRENLEGMIDELCYEYGYYRPRTYRKNARRAKSALRKKSARRSNSSSSTCAVTSDTWSGCRKKELNFRPNGDSDMKYSGRFMNNSGTCTRTKCTLFQTAS